MIHYDSKTISASAIATLLPEWIHLPPSTNQPVEQHHSKLHVQEKAGDADLAKEIEVTVGEKLGAAAGEGVGEVVGATIGELLLGSTGALLGAEFGAFPGRIIR